MKIYFFCAINFTLVFWSFTKLSAHKIGLENHEKRRFLRFLWKKTVFENTLCIHIFYNYNAHPVRGSRLQKMRSEDPMAETIWKKQNLESAFGKRKTHTSVFCVFSLRNRILENLSGLQIASKVPKFRKFSLKFEEKLVLETRPQNGTYFRPCCVSS